MENTYKRRYRQLDDATKLKISQALRGRSKSATHAEAISTGLKNYWQQVPEKPNNNEIKKKDNE